MSPHGNLASLELAIAQEGTFDIFSSSGSGSSRELTQQGFFTWLTHNKCLDVEGYLTNQGMIEHLKRYDIPCQEWGSALWDFHLMNINHAILFPDADGAARQENLGNYYRGPAQIVTRIKEGWQFQ